MKRPQKATVLDYERGVAADIQDNYWQSDMTMAEDWFLKPKADGSSDMRHNAMSLKELLVDIVSKRGVLLLNLAVNTDGSIPQDHLKVMEKLGSWIVVNGEAIFATEPLRIYGEGGVTVGGQFNVRGIKALPWDRHVLGFTRNKLNTVLYVYVFGSAGGKVIIINSFAIDKGLFRGAIKNVTIINNTDSVNWSMNKNGLSISMPGNLADKDCNVIRIEVDSLIS